MEDVGEMRDVGEVGVIGLAGTDAGARDVSGGRESFGRSLLLGRERPAPKRLGSRRGEGGAHRPIVMVGTGPARVVNSGSGRRVLPERSGDSEMFTGRSGALD